MRGFIVISFILCSTFICCQNYDFHKINFGVNEGLPSSECYEIIQDSKGYIWFGTDRGVVRYNGYEFKTYTTKQGLNNNVVFYLYESNDGKIWFYDLERELSYFENDSIHLYQHNAIIKENYNAKAVPLGFYVDDLGTVHFSTKNSNKTSRILRSINESGEFTFYEADLCTIIFNETNQGTEAFYSYDFGRSKNIINKVMTPGENLKLNYNVCYQNDNYSTSEVITNATAFNSSVPRYTSEDGKLYFSLLNELYLIERGFPLKRLLTFEKGIIELEIINGDVYIGFFDKGLKVLPSGDPERMYSLFDGCSVSGVLLDRNKSIWVTTQDQGVFYIPHQDFHHHLSSKNKSIITISGNRASIVYSDYEGFLYNLNKSSLFSLALPSPSYIRNIIPFGDKGFLASLISQYSCYYRTIEARPELIPRTQKFEGFNKQVSGAANDWMNTDSLLFGVFSNKISGFDKNLNYVYRKSLDDMTVLNCLSRGFEENEMFLGRNDGLYLFPNDSLKKLCPNNTLLNGRISDLETIKDVLYITTRGEGLVVYKKGKVPYAITKGDGLISNELHKLKYFGHHLFVLSKEGLSVLDLNSEKHIIHNYSNKNGLLSNEVNDIYYRNDTVWLATNRGIAMFELNRVKYTYPDEPIYLTSIKINDKAISLNNLSILPYNRNNLEFSFEALSFLNQGKIKYRYKLLGIDLHWNETMSRELRLPNLPSGKFSFIISYQKPDMTWSAPTTLFQFEIKKPFWEEAMFIALSVVLTAFIIAIIVYRIISIAKARIETQRTILDLERSALQAQMNPHFIFNALTSIQSLIAQNKNDNAETFLVAFSKLVRSSLNHSSKSYISLEDELDLLNNYLKIEGLRFQETFNWEMKVTNKFDVEDIFIPPMILQPFIENSIEHGIRPLKRKGNIRVSINPLNDEFIEVKVDDDGIGRLKAQNKHIKDRESKGIQLVIDRLKLLNKRSVVKIIDKTEDETPKGTLVLIHLPYQKDYR